MDKDERIVDKLVTLGATTAEADKFLRLHEGIYLPAGDDEGLLQIGYGDEGEHSSGKYRANNNPRPLYYSAEDLRVNIALIRENNRMDTLRRFRVVDGEIKVVNGYGRIVQGHGFDPDFPTFEIIEFGTLEEAKEIVERQEMVEVRLRAIYRAHPDFDQKEAKELLGFPPGRIKV